MRKNENFCHIEGYVYDCSKLVEKVTGEKSKNPGTHYISGNLDVATDEAGLNVITVHFTYVTEVFAKGKTNATYGILQKIIAAPEKTWIGGGKENATMVKIDGNIELNDFIAADGQQVSARRMGGSFVTLTNQLCEEDRRSTFSADMVINRVNHIDADPDKNIKEDYVSVNGGVFNFRNEFLPVDFIVRNPGGMKYFEELGVSNSEPVYTKVWGKINYQTVKIEKSQESAFGDSAVTTFERRNKEWIITGTAKVPYDFGEDGVMTADELTKALQDREVHWADIKKQNDEYLASKSTVVPAAAPAKPGEFRF